MLHLVAPVFAPGRAMRGSSGALPRTQWSHHDLNGRCVSMCVSYSSLLTPGGMCLACTFVAVSLSSSAVGAVPPAPEPADPLEVPVVDAPSVLLGSWPPVGVVDVPLPAAAAVGVVGPGAPGVPEDVLAIGASSTGASLLVAQIGIVSL